MRSKKISAGIKAVVCMGLAVFWSVAFAQNIDPTIPGAKMADALKRRMVNHSSLKIHALVVGRGGDGVALIGENSESAVAVRKGGVMNVDIDGVKMSVEVKSVKPEGVELALSEKDKGLVIPGSFTSLPLPENSSGALLRYIESEDVPIGRLMRLVADQTGVNISASDATSSKRVSIFLRNVTPEAAVEEICRATGLWFRKDVDGGVIRVTTMAEYADNLHTFREEMTETFTLLYPNVIEVASVIYGLYPDRTLVSLGEEEFLEDDENDLSERFRRFRVIEENGNSQFMDLQAPQASSAGSRSGSGAFSFSRGSAASRLTQWDQLYDRNRRRAWEGNLSVSEAKGIEAAGNGITNSFERANIFVSMSRKNNMLVVRTSDSKVMDEVKRLVKKLDVPTPMVLMEVKVLELDVTDDFEAGVEWTLRDGKEGSDNGLATHALGHDGTLAPNLMAQALSGGRAAFDPTFSFAVVSDYVRTKISLMQKDGKVKTIATPTLLSANNEVSRIFSGKEYPLVTGWTKAESTGTQGVVVTTPATAQIERKDVGTMLLITPNINADKTVTLRLLQENSEIGANKVDIPVDGGTGEAKAIEYVESRSLTGTFVAKDDMTVLAGGLIKESVEDVKWRTPFLGSIPGLGWLFRGTEKAKRRTELVILIKPHVIATPMEGGKISAELMEALSSHPAADGRPNMNVFKEKGDRPNAFTHTVKDDFDNLVK